LGLAATNPQCGNGGRCDTQADDLDKERARTERRQATQEEFNRALIRYLFDRASQGYVGDTWGQLFTATVTTVETPVDPSSPPDDDPAQAILDKLRTDIADTYQAAFDQAEAIPPTGPLRHVLDPGNLMDIVQVTLYGVSIQFDKLDHVIGNGAITCYAKTREILSNRDTKLRSLEQTAIRELNKIGYDRKLSKSLIGVHWAWQS
jgi:hypothetical protein